MWNLRCERCERCVCTCRRTVFKMRGLPATYVRLRDVGIGVTSGYTSRRRLSDNESLVASKWNSRPSSVGAGRIEPKARPRSTMIRSRCGDCQNYLVDPPPRLESWWRSGTVANFGGLQKQHMQLQPPRDPMKRRRDQARVGPCLERSSLCGRLDGCRRLRAQASPSPQAELVAAGGEIECVDQKMLATCAGGGDIVPAGCGMGAGAGETRACNTQAGKYAGESPALLRRALSRRFEG